MMRPHTFYYPVQGVASDICIELHVWDVEHGRVVDEAGVVHCLVVVMCSNLDGTDERILDANASPCANGVYVDSNTTITCIACLARGPAFRRKPP